MGHEPEPAASQRADCETDPPFGAGGAEWAREAANCTEAVGWMRRICNSRTARFATTFAPRRPGIATPHVERNGFTVVKHGGGRGGTLVVSVPGRPLSICGPRRWCSAAPAWPRSRGGIALRGALATRGSQEAERVARSEAEPGMA